MKLGRSYEVVNVYLVAEPHVGRTPRTQIVCYIENDDTRSLIVLHFHRVWLYRFRLLELLRSLEDFPPSPKTHQRQVLCCRGSHRSANVVDCTQFRVMAQVATVSFGAELKDGYKPVDSWVTNGIAWLEEIQQFYQERAAIEKEYSAKLSALAKKYYDKKAKRSSSLSVGDTPSMTPGSLESASVTTWGTQLSTLESCAAEHARLSQDFVSQVASPLEYVQKRMEEIRKSHAEYQGKLLKEREASYGDLKKLKSRYDTVCQDVENRRKKSESAMDGGRGKAASAYNTTLMEMHNVKNTYLIGINVTNKLKERYYHEYVPELLDSLQDLSETRTTKLNAIWALAAALETASLKRRTDQMNHLSTEIPRNNPSLDSIMFVRHNAVQWMDPGDMIFEPSPVWLDSDAMAVDDTAKIFLRNILAKSKPLIKELQNEAAAKQREVENVKKARQNIREGRDKRDEVDCVRSQFAIQEEMHAITRRKVTAEVETSTITSVVGDLSLRGKNHTFKGETFKIPTNCDLCGDRIWGLSAKGFSCNECGYTCHSKCELKVPADCPGEQSKEEKKKLKAERQANAAKAAEAPVAVPNGSNPPPMAPTLVRQNTMNSLSSGYALNAQRSVSGTVPTVGTSSDQSSAPSRAVSSATSIPENNSPATAGARRNRIVAPPPTAYVSAPPSNEATADEDSAPRGKVLYSYEAREEGELSVREGKEVTIVEPDGKLQSVVMAIAQC